jgi:hypothetical protein
MLRVHVCIRVVIVLTEFGHAQLSRTRIAARGRRVVQRKMGSLNFG